MCGQILIILRVAFGEQVHEKSIDQCYVISPFLIQNSMNQPSYD